MASDILARGGRAVDAVEQAVRALEDDPVFNAGVGSSLNERGEVEHDAGIMVGDRLAAGAVCSVVGFGNPISLARAVMDDGRHVLLSGQGAADFGLARGFETVDPSRLVTDHAKKALERVRSKDGGNEHMSWAGGTVGAVARDTFGNCAAATSTGGTVNKRVGRVGDSPVLGAGTYADDEAGAVSATGMGEGILRVALASQMIEAMRRGQSAREASVDALARKLGRLGTTAGVIAVDRDGALGVARSTETMSFAAHWAGAPSPVWGS